VKPKNLTFLLSTFHKCSQYRFASCWRERNGRVAAHRKTTAYNESSD